jgi:uncharacterized protein
MDVAHELVGLLERFAVRTPLPKVRALHLPPSAMPTSIAGEFCAIELDDNAGLELEGADALAVARWFTGAPGARRALGFAAVNALTRCMFDRAGFLPGPSGDSIGMLAPQTTDHIGMIGLFPPLVRSIVKAGSKLTVLELRADLAGDRDGYRVTTDRSELATCSKVIATSTLLLNDSLDAMLSACSQASSFALIGPGAGCLPDPLFARGVTLVGGAWITDREAFCAALATGSAWTDAARKVALRREDYPGFDTLLDRL